MKITNAIWFAEMGIINAIGIVFGEDEVTKEKKAYIGTGNGFDKNGFDKRADCESIATRGAKFSLGIAKEIVRQLEENEK